MERDQRQRRSATRCIDGGKSTTTTLDCFNDNICPRRRTRNRAAHVGKNILRASQKSYANMLPTFCSNVVDHGCIPCPPALLALYISRGWAKTHNTVCYGCVSVKGESLFCSKGGEGGFRSLRFIPTLRSTWRGAIKPVPSHSSVENHREGREASAVIFSPLGVPPSCYCCGRVWSLLPHHTETCCLHIAWKGEDRAQGTK